jgi:chromosome segregation ATPase
MADNQKVEEGAVSQPEEQVSKSIDDKTIKLLSDLGGQVETLQKELRGLQGRQDKVDSTFKQTMADYQKLLNRGMSHEEAVDALESKQKETSTLTELQKQVQELAQQLAGRQPNPEATQQVVKAFESFDLDMKDPRVLVAMQKHYPKMGDALEAAFKLKEELSKSPNPAKSQSASAEGANTGSIDVAALVAESEVLMREPSKNYERILEINDALRKAGALT